MADIIMTPVSSSNIQAIGYDKLTSVLQVQYKSGLYKFTGISPEFFRELMNAPSKGKFMNASGKKGVKIS